MKWKLSTLLLLGITIILCFTYFKQKQEIFKLNEQSLVVGKTDTIYVGKPFKREPAFNTIQLPRYVFLYEPLVNVTDSPVKPEVHREDSLIQVILSRKDLALSFVNTVNSSNFKLAYKIDLDNYEYNWVDGNLTSNKLKTKLKFVPYIYTKYRPIHSMIDLGLGLSLNTQRFNYKFGLTGYYYPGLNNKIGIDPEFKIIYNLSK